MSTKPLNTDEEKIVLTPTQQNPAAAKPEDFEIVCGGTAEYEDESVSGQLGESGRRRTPFRSEAEHHSVVNPNSIPV
jgi:hypothetical protein